MSIPTPQAFAVTQALSSRCWVIADLANHLGLAVAVVRDVVSGCKRSSRVRRKIEIALVTPIWATTEEFSRLPAIKERTGCDIALAGRTELEALVKMHQIPLKRRASRHPTRPELVAAITAHFFPDSTTPRPQPNPRTPASKSKKSKP